MSRSSLVVGLNSAVLMAALLLWPLGLAGCGEKICDWDPAVDGGTPGDPPLEGALDSCDHPLPVPDRPTVELPVIPDTEYLVELQRWSIHNDNSHADETTDGINDALQWAAEQGYGRFVLPTGTYLVGTDTVEGGYHWADSIKMPSSMALVMDSDTVIQLITSEAPAYCIISVGGQTDVAIIGGTIRGDRQTHDYSTGPGTQEESHCVCVDNLSNRVLIDGVNLEDPGGDGVLILGAPADDGATTDNVTIRDCDIARGRRQGISIVGGAYVAVLNNEIHHIEGTAPQFGIDIEGQGRDDHDILIEGNSFHHNAGGDIANSSGTNVWIENNTFDQTGLAERQTDGPVVYWINTNSVIRGNSFQGDVGSSNGWWAIIGYTRRENARTNPFGTVIEDNVFNDCGLHMMFNSGYRVAGNVFNNGQMLGTHLTCLEVVDNEVHLESGEPYKFRNVRGQAGGNLHNGEPYELLMSDDEPFTNSSPSQW